MHAIGMLETTSIARGILATDAMLKAAGVKLLSTNPVCPGKYFTYISGTVSDIRSSIDAGITAAGESLVGSDIIPNVHPSISPAIMGTTFVENIGAIGVIETFTGPSAIMAADEAVKSAKIELMEIRLHRAIGGKAFTMFTGEVGAVKAALAAGINRVKESGLILSTVLIPAPHKSLIDQLL